MNQDTEETYEENTTHDTGTMSFFTLEKEEELKYVVKLMGIPSERRSTAENTAIQLQLSKIKYFKDLAIKHGFKALEHVCREIQARSYKKGEVVFHQGDQGSEFYVIINGGVGVYVKDAQTTQPKKVNLLGPGDYFGELALIQGKNGLRAASVVAKEATDLAYFTRESFNKLLFESERNRFDENYEFLKNLKLMEGMPDALHRDIYVYSKLKIYTNGQAVYNFDDAIDNVYIVRQGCFEVSTQVKLNDQSQASTVVICKTNAGEIFGYEEMLLGCKRRWTVKCVSAEGELFVLSQKEFRNRALIYEEIVKRLNMMIRSKNILEKHRISLQKRVQQKQLSNLGLVRQGSMGLMRQNSIGSYQAAEDTSDTNSLDFFLPEIKDRHKDKMKSSASIRNSPSVSSRDADSPILQRANSMMKSNISIRTPPPIEKKQISYKPSRFQGQHQQQQRDELEVSDEIEQPQKYEAPRPYDFDQPSPGTQWSKFRKFANQLKIAQEPLNPIKISQSRARILKLVEKE